MVEHAVAAAGSWEWLATPFGGPGAGLWRELKAFAFLFDSNLAMANLEEIKRRNPTP